MIETKTRKEKNSPHLWKIHVAMTSLLELHIQIFLQNPPARTLLVIKRETFHDKTKLKAKRRSLGSIPKWHIHRDG